MKITGTFLDEITHDIPSLNWDEEDWDRDFKLMKAVGIDKAIMIRCGWKNWITYPSEILMKYENAIAPSNDLVAMFLRLSEKYGIKFYFGTYFSGRDWLLESYNIEHECNLMQWTCKEVWDKYGKTSPAFGGWYLSQEISTAISWRVVECYKKVGKFCKEISGNLPVMISPGFKGVKGQDKGIPYAERRRNAITPEEHRKDWDWIFNEIKGAVDVVAFQDGHLDYDELEMFLKINKELADKHGLTLLTNAETFDRDIPGFMPPVKWEKLRVKLEAARNAGITEGVTFDFAHFLSPHSCYPQAKNLLKQYCTWAGVDYKSL